VRDIPDVALFASNGLNFSAYPICAQPGDCVPDASGNGTITLVGGTSASTPAMAGIMVLVNQKYGRQGQANFTLYPLAQQFPAAFHDVTLGSNNMTCLQGTPDCSLDKTGDSFYSLQEYPATAGYDLASGLGSVDASVLINDWNSITFKPTTTAMQVSPVSAQHGEAISFTVTVKPSSGGGTPQGSVTILNNSPVPLSAAQGVATLASDGTATITLDNLPGGSYQVWAQYAGDGSYASSYSNPQTVTITPASGSLTLGGFGVGSLSGYLNPADACQAVLFPNEGLLGTEINSGPWGPFPNGWSYLPNEPVAAMAAVNGSFAQLISKGITTPGNGTGNVTFSLDGQPLNTTALNSGGYASWVAPAVLGAGNHSIGATATAAPFTFSVTQARTTLAVQSGANCTLPPGSTNYVCAFNAGDNLPVMVQLQANSCQYPTGTVAVNLGPLTQNLTLSPGGMARDEGTVLLGEALFLNLPAGTYSLSATYAGDANSLPATATNSDVVATAPPAALQPPPNVTISANPSSLNFDTGGATSFSATVTGGSNSSVPPTGSVMILDDGLGMATVNLTPSGPNSATGTSIASALAEYFDYGVNHVIGIYPGDSNYQASTSAPMLFDYVVPNTPDFLLAPQLPQVTVPSGSSATVGFNLNSLDDFNGTVALSCAPSSSLITCGLSPATVTVNGQATATLTMTAAAQTTSLVPSKGQRQSRWPVGPSMIAFAFLLVGGRASRKLRRNMLLTLCLFAAMLVIGCGGGTIPTITQTPPPTLVTYSVVVTGTANGIIHNAKITVVVP
jgi:hypothetical protein